jgi:hypothetical protein
MKAKSFGKSLLNIEQNGHLGMANVNLRKFAVKFDNCVRYSGRAERPTRPRVLTGLGVVRIVSYERSILNCTDSWRESAILNWTELTELDLNYGSVTWTIQSTDF